MANHPHPMRSEQAGLTSAQEARVVEIATRHLDREGALLPVLHDVQAAFGCIPRDAVPLIAQVLNLSRADVHGVVSFYHDFREEPAGAVHVKVCRGEACQAMGADALAARVLEAFGVRWHETTADASCTVSPVFCLGLCSVAPAVQIGDELLGRASAEVVIRRARVKS
jgi:formate dehydrogenase subunit gamma